MKIEKIETIILEDPYLPQLFVRVSTEDGFTGLGECWWGISPAAPEIKDLNLPPANMVDPIASTVNNILGPVVINQDADRIEQLWHKMVHFAYRYGDEGILRCALSGIDLALWDLGAKKAGVPVVQLLGGKVKDRVRAYASLPPLKDAALVCSESRRAREKGFTGVKLHELKPEMAREVREAVGPDVAIMFDVNGHFSSEEACGVATQLLKYDTFWFEEPTWPMRDHGAMTRVRQETGIRIAAGENEFNPESFERLMTSGAVDYVMPEISKIGGLTAATKVSEMAERHNLPISPHGYRIGPALYANVHWALSCPHSDWIEVPFLPEGYGFPAKISLPPMEGGTITLPQGPGLGLPEELKA
jgi:L-alanine-DL-glutamate epimerase-like enolase superfamily enzyme